MLNVKPRTVIIYMCPLQRLIIKTCGTTTPLTVLHDLSRVVKKYAGFDRIEDIFYSRKNFERPELQLQPHGSFDQEVLNNCQATVKIIHVIALGCPTG